MSTRQVGCEALHALAKLPRLDASNPLTSMRTSPFPLHAFLRGDADEQDAAGDYRLVDETTVRIACQLLAALSTVRTDL